MAMVQSGTFRFPRLTMSPFQHTFFLIRIPTSKGINSKFQDVRAGSQKNSILKYSITCLRKPIKELFQEVPYQGFISCYHFLFIYITCILCGKSCNQCFRSVIYFNTNPVLNVLFMKKQRQRDIK